MGKQGQQNAQANGGASGQSNNCASFIAGLIEGLLNSAKMQCKVTAHLYGEETQNAAGAEGEEDAASSSQTTIYVIKFAKEVTARERQT